MLGFFCQPSYTGQIVRIILKRKKNSIKHHKLNSYIFSLKDLSVKEEDSRGQIILLTEVYELQYNSLWALVQVQVNNNLLQSLSLARVLVIFDNVVLYHIIRQLPFLESTSHYEGLKLLDKELLNFLFLEEPKQIFEQKIAVFQLNTKFYGNSNQDFKLFLSFVLILLQFL